jgi:hypothetical protein
MPDDLACCMKSLFGNADLRHRISLAAQHNASRFSWNRAAVEMETLFMMATGC